jgi:hypothetical protein
MMRPLMTPAQKAQEYGYRAVGNLELFLRCLGGDDRTVTLLAQQAWANTRLAAHYGFQVLDAQAPFPRWEPGSEPHVVGMDAPTAENDPAGRMRHIEVLPGPPPPSLQGWPVLDPGKRLEKDALYVRIPKELQRLCDGCSCRYCVEHPDQEPAWDTMGIPLDGGMTWTLHAPEWTAKRGVTR